MAQVEPWDVHEMAKDDEEAGLVSVCAFIRGVHTNADTPRAKAKPDFPPS